MFGTTSVKISTCPSMLSSTLTTIPQSSPKILPYLSPKPRTRLTKVRAMSASTEHTPPSASPEKNNLLAVFLDVPQKIWKQTLRPLSDFGFGRRSIWEGGVGLFLVSGTVLLALSLAWLRGFQIRSKFRKYLAVFEFAQASGICTGTPVRIRGVTVGNVVRVNPSLKSIEAVVEVEDDKIIIPQNSLIEVNQSGLLMETLIDITPRDPIPTPSVGPLDTDCIKEGLIVCDRQKIKGQQGIEAMAEDVQPLLSEVRDSGLLKEVENLTRSLTQASEDLRRVQSSVMTTENTELLQKSIYSLIFTLKNIENISSDIMGFTGDESTRKNLKSLIKSLSRLL
ncbi:protein TRIGALACTOSYLDIACYLGLYCEROL 2, chloroplastic-like isoform X3 [Durio zibethinus]|uniref:Protein TRIGALACTOSYLDIACYLGLYCEROL 2, chloroplastic-like isoform X3 n=1 Tax=Durio zibethinus TaxID=66656 RepID=A0A6P5X5Y4_DURZI|nr:protein TRIGALACTOSYLDIACYLGLYCEROL 2, chloroplastic-like isoform X3 [Durio zibethinus]